MLLSRRKCHEIKRACSSQIYFCYSSVCTYVLPTLTLGSQELVVISMLNSCSVFLYTGEIAISEKILRSLSTVVWLSQSTKLEKFWINIETFERHE